LLLVLLSIGLLNGTNSVLGQSALTYTSTSDGEWVGASPNIINQINSYSDYTEVTIPSQYSGRRWDNPGRSESLNVDESTGDFDLQLSYPGSLNVGGYGPLDNAIIKHNITLSSPYSGYGDNGSLNQLTIQSGGQLTIGGPFSLAAEGLVTNAGTLNINGSANINANGGVTNTGTFNVSDSANITVKGGVTNAGILNVSDSAQVSFTGMDNAGTLLLKNYNKQINATTFNNNGTFALQDGSVGNVSGDINFTNNGKISVNGNNNILKGDNVHINTSAFNIEGTDVTKDFLTVDAKIDGSGAGKFNFKDVSVTLSDTFYNNNNSLTALEFTNSGIVTGNGKSNVDYTLSNGAGIHVPGTFTGHDFKFQDGSILYTKIGSALWDRLVATGNIEFTGNTKVILLNYGNHEAQVNADKIIEAAGKITVGGSDLAQNMVSTVANNSATITGGTSQVVVESAKSNGVDQLLINEIHVTDKMVSLNVTGDKTTTPPLNPGIPPGTYTGQGFKFQDGSILYTKIGSDQWDKRVAEGNIEFTGNTKVILLNYGNHEAQVNADNIIETTAGKITVGDSDLNQSMVSTIDNNNATITDGTSQVVVESAKSGNVDQLQINEINVTDKTVSVKITGNKTTTPPPVNPPDNPSYPGNPIFGTSNLEVLGDVLLAIGPSNEIYQAIAGYAGNDQDKLMAALSQLDPVILSVATTQSLDAVQKFITAGHRRSFERLGTIYQSDFSGQFVGQVEAVDATVLGQCAAQWSAKNSCSLWFQALGGWQNQSTTGVEGYSADTFGFVLGADQQITSDALLGVSFGGHFSNATSKSGNNSAKTDTLLFSVYGGRRIDNLFFNASAGYAGGCLESKRSTSALGGWANSKRNAESYFGNLEMAYRFGNKLSYLTPFISYDFIRYEENAFTETGNIALNIAERKANAYFQTLGARFGCQAEHSGILLNPELTLGWLHDYGSGSLHTTGQFVSGGPAFTVVGVSRNKNRGVLGVKIDAELSKWTNAFLRYDVEFATHYNAQYLTGGINIAF
jgi:uncharacterized protein with beta-barrel porin domain